MTTRGQRANLRMRPDLILSPRGAGASRHWIVEDPVAAKYFRLRDEECFILRRLDGRASLRELKRGFEERFYPLRLGFRSLNGFLFHLHELGLVVGENHGQAEVLARRDQRNRRRRWLAILANPLAIRLPGYPARRLVDRLYPALRWLLSPIMLALWSTVVLAATTLVTLRFATLQQRLPTFDQFFQTPALGGFLIAVVLIKALHELGHALVSRHVGGSCRQIGVMLLMGMPTLYCDTSDAWRVPRRGPRVLIALAGVAVELIIAAIATLVWWFSEPGGLNTFALQVAFLCSVSTLLFNANPLVRADAYYVLADWLDLPNLWQESRAVWRRAWNRWLTGRPAPDDLPGRPFRGQTLGLMAYAAASTLYRWILVGGFLWFLFRVLEPLGYALLAVLLAVPVVAAVVVPPLHRMTKALASPVGRRVYVNRRLATVPLTLAVIVGGILFMPLPRRVTAPCWIDLHQGQTVYASVAGQLRWSAVEGQPVAMHEPVARLEDPASNLRLAELRADVRSRQRNLENLRRLQTSDPTVGASLPAEQQSLEDAIRRLALHQQDHDRLTLLAPVGGVVLSPAIEGRIASDPTSNRLAGFQGSPLDPKNLGAWIEVGQAVCVIGDPGSMEANLVIRQDDVANVAPGRRVVLRIDQAPVRTLTGTVTAIAKATADDLPDSLRQRLGLATTNRGLVNAAAETHYQATVRIDPRDPDNAAESAADLTRDATGVAKIEAEWQSLAGRLLRYFRRNFTLR